MENEKEKTCICKQCGRSSVAGSICAFEESERMCFCPTFIKMKENKKP